MRLNGHIRLNVFFLYLCLFLASLVVTVPPARAQNEARDLYNSFKDNPDYQEYLAFFKKVYQTLQENYYYPVTEESLNKFLYVFNKRIYSQLRQTGKTKKFIKWRSAAFLVDALKDPEDIFSKFLPPKAAKEYESKVLGKRINLGIEGTLTPKGFEVTRLQIRSDAYEQGLREKDILLRINDEPITALTEDAINELLTPEEHTVVTLTYLGFLDQKEFAIDVVSKEYFKQFVFLIPVDVPHVYCIQIERFNRMTGEDMERFMRQILEEDEDSGLIIDLRGNPGGPPLAAREISSFFLSPNEEFAYFQKRNRPPAHLYVPEIPAEFRYGGDIVILVDENSGSASELFSGILQGKNRAVVMGQNTAGQVLLKSMFYFDDDSMVLLVTARGFHPDGTVFSFDGVEPNEKVADKEIDLVAYAARYLADRRRNRETTP